MTLPDAVGKGIYSIPEAARWGRMKAGHVRRWIKGYRYTYRGERRASSPVVHHDYEPVDDQWTLSFADLVDVRFVDAFRAAGVSMPTLRKAYAKAVEHFGSRHPFNLKTIRTDGQRIFAQLQDEEGEEGGLLELARDQHVFAAIVDPFLKNLEFDADEIARCYWPLGADREVVLDPARAFGRPIVHSWAVPTEPLFALYRQEASPERVAEIYEIGVDAVEDAIEFEESLRRAAA